MLAAIGMPRAQQNERSAMSLLALLDLRPGMPWSEASARLVGMRGTLDFVRTVFRRTVAENTRETYRRQTMHQFVAAGIAMYNPDSPERPVNSPKTVYQVAPEALTLFRSYGTHAWAAKLADFKKLGPGLAERYSRPRELQRIDLRRRMGQELRLSPGGHSDLVRAVVDEFGPRFVPGGTLLYVGDTEEKWAYFDEAHAKKLGLVLDAHGKMPDVLILDEKRRWLFLIEAVTSHGPVNAKRHEELVRLFAGVDRGKVFVTAFPSRATMARFIQDIAWETEVWVSDNPSHLIHFDGTRFLGPHAGS